MISCGCGEGDGEWQWYGPDSSSPLNTKRSRKCCSCGTKIAIGEECYTIWRFRQPKHEIEERIYGDLGDIPIAPWWWCEKCGDMYHNITEAGFCVSLEKGGNIIEEWKELQRGLRNG